ncbi:hypothetical protein FOPG_18299 [Fusarium oxysporum f. sp. conglutinans race 2 54008]|uniref:F-box domain-containing protein n=1 Tax=Fusarium oxysporum f. sp. conglutinans race 2 54008 TaxID=1089457 RepID=X0H029_FUSOX|nr:hypothetical protein FOPG_18299 [Fusarium oxysporum f. sp. conglutinans race 2 54008]KAI8406192.1 hypothetical protein FOFC_13661 [Fusarium oxysporum]
MEVRRSARNAPAVPSTRKRKASWDEEEQPMTNANAYSTSISLASDEALKDKFSNFPAEILQLILESVDDKPSMAKMACTSKSYYSLVLPILHKRISVSANHWRHTHNVIRRLVPYLSLAQKKQLKKETTYKNQQEKFSNSVDPDALPPCASNVRQMIIGSINPGIKKKDTIMRYLEEVMKNLYELKVFMGHELTESMSKSLAAQKNLEALSIDNGFKEDAFESLAKISNLQHLRVSCSGVVNHEKVLSSMLLNSLKTLKSVKISASWYWSGFMDNWEEDIKAWHPKTWERTPHFTSLRSLSLSQITFNSKLIQNLSQAVDFLKLTELEITGFGDRYKDIGVNGSNGHLEFFKYLKDLFKKTDKADIHLRNLSLQLSGYWDKERRAIEEDLKDIYRFMSSFDTLICLEIHDYNTYLSNVESSPGLLLPLEQSILKHNELEELHFHHKDAFSGHELPCFTAASVEVLVKNLPKLRVLELAPSGDNKEKMLRALSGAENLTTLIFNHKQTLYPRSDFPEDHHTMVVKGVLEGFMEYASCPGEFIWEKHYKLSKFKIGSDAYVIGSNLKHRKGWFKIRPVKVAKGDRAVMFQDLRRGKRASQDNSYYVPDSEWMNKVTKPNQRAQCS